MKVAEVKVLAPAVTTDKEPDLANEPAPPRRIPPPAAPVVVATVGAKAIVPPETVVPLETTMSVTLEKLVPLVKVTLLLASLEPELNEAKVPLYVPLVLEPVVAPTAILANASATSAPLLATVAV